MNRSLIVALIALVFAGCAAKTVPSVPPSSLEGKLAVQARSVVLASDGLLQAVDAAVSSGLVTREQAIAVPLATRQIGLAGQQLAAVLRVVDVASGATKDRAVADALSILSKISDLVTGLPQPVRTALPDQAVAILTEVSRLRLALP